MKTSLLIATLISFSLNALSAPQKSSAIFESEIQSLKARSSELSREMDKAWYKVQRQIKSYTAKLPSLDWNKISSKILGRKSAPPVLEGEIFFLKQGDGSHPIVKMNFLGTVSDPDGTISKVRWDFGDGSSSEHPGSEVNTVVSHVYPNSDHYVVSYSVEDNTGEVTTITTYVETPENTAPSFYVTTEFSPSNPLEATYHVHASDTESSSFSYVVLACNTLHFTESVTCTYPAPGGYPLFVRVTDSLGTSSEHTSVVLLFGGTHQSFPFPVIKANTLFGTAPLTVDFDASESFDMDGGALTYRWAVEGESIGNTSESEKFSYHFRRPGTYTVSLTARDPGGFEWTEKQEIFVAGNIEPTPQIIATYAGPNAVNFDGSALAFDVAAPKATAYKWDFGDGTNATGAFQSKTYSAPGTYLVKLSIYDVFGQFHELENNLTIGASDDSPVVMEAQTHYQPNIGQEVTFNAEESYDPNGEPLQFLRYFSDEFRSNDPVVVRRFNERGVNQTRVVVTNSRGLSSIGYSQVIVQDMFTTLFPQITYSPKAGAFPLTVHYDASLTTTGTPIVSHEWIVNGAVISRTSEASHTFTDPGSYYTHYYVKNAAGESSSTNGLVLVFDGASIPPENNAPTAVISDSTNPTTREYAFSCHNSTDADGEIVGCNWKINGISVSDDFYLSTKLPEDIFYSVELTVVDNWGASSKAVRQYDFSANPTQLITFDYTPITPASGEEMRFGAEVARIPGQTISDYQWDFGDGNTGNGLTTSHTFAAAGIYNVQLVMTTTSKATYSVTKTIEVLAVANSFAVAPVATSSDLAGRAAEGETYRAFGAPEDITFNVLATSSSPSAVKDAQWDFGDGSSGLGTTVEHTFHRPGTYTVVVTATDWNDNTDSAEITVVVPNSHGCYQTDGENLCLSDEAANDTNISPNTSNWVITHDQSGVEFSSAPADYPLGWAQLISENGEKIYDVSNAVTATLDQLTINRTKLPVEVDLNFPHKLVIATRSSTGEPLLGSLPYHRVGLSSLTVDVGDPDMRLEVVNPSAGIRKQVDLGSSTTYTFNDLPPGHYAIITSANNESTLRVTTVKRGANTFIVEDKKLESQSKRKPLKLKDIHEFHQKLAKQSSWSQSLCGEASPFPANKARPQEAGETREREFSSLAPEIQSKFRQVSDHTGKVGLSCVLTSPALLYGQNKWKYKDGPARCGDDESPHAYWQEYLATLSTEDLPVIIKYEIRDAWTEQSFTAHFVTSGKELLRKNGLRIQDLSNRIGLPESEGTDWGHRFNYEIAIPPHFRRPEIRFELLSHHDSSPQSPYSVTCDVRVSSVLPKLAGLEASQLTGDVHSASENGRLSLSSRYGLFPVQHDDRVSSPLALRPDIAKAQYRAKIQYFDRSDITWQGMEVQFRYGNKVFTNIYPFTGTPSTDSLGETYENTFVVDTADLKNRFRWVRGEKTVDLTFTPVGKVTEDYDYRGLSKVKTFKALFDAKTVRANMPQVCSGGIYPSEFTAFTQDDLLSVILDGFTEGKAIRCGEISAPFGGPLEISETWKRLGHQHGNEATIRTFNTAPGIQDNYDTFSGTALRREDAEAYMTFSNAIKNLIAIQNEEQGGLPTNKKKLVDYCNPVGGPVVSPCFADTTFGNITEAMAHELCLTNARTPNLRPPGCPMPALGKLVRFVRWVDLNRTSFDVLLRRTALEGIMASGQLTPDSLVLDNGWQRKALVEGKWPDGHSIYLPAVDETFFTAERLTSCEDAPVQCARMKNLFTRETTQFDGMTIKTSWR